MPRRNTIEIIIKAEDRASAVLGKIGGNVKTLGTLALGGLGVAAGAAGALGAAMTKLAVDAAPLKGVEDAFTGIAEASGESADEMLRALEKGSAGMVAQADLMKTYNLAAQLVGDTFANQLPDAMTYLGKVSAATGEDMGYMLDSLVRGVGRLSPMILDNLGIQVDLTAAYEAYADSIGKGVKELTKQEQQTALMNQVMEKLAENTANMPEVAGTAAASIAALQAKFKNLKDSIGKALLPVLEIALDWFTKAADVVIPKIIGAVETLSFILQAFLSGTPGDFPWEDVFPEWLADFMYKLSDIFEGFVMLFQDIQAGVFGMDYPWEDIFPPWLADVGYTLTKIYQAIAPLISGIIDLVSSFVSWKDVLLTLGIAIATVIIPILASLVFAAARVLATAAALVAAIALVRNVWESNFLGIRTVVETVLSVIAARWTATWEMVKSAWDAFWGGLKPALDSMYAKLQEFWAEIQPKLAEAWSALQGLWTQIVSLWNENVTPALKKLAEALGISGGETDKFWEILGKLVGFMLESQLDVLIKAITVAVNALAGAIQGAVAIVSAFRSGLDAIRGAIQSLQDVSLPSWLTPGSPTPFETGIRGIVDAMGDLNAATSGLGMAPAGGAAFGGAGIAAGGGGGDQAVLYKMLTELQELVKLGREHGVVVVEAGAGNGERARDHILGLEDMSYGLMPG